MSSSPLYFAYGSNLNAEDLKQWCDRKGQPYPIGPKISNAYLPDTQLVFNYQSPQRRGGMLNIRHRLGQATPGVLFHMEPEHWSILNLREGAPLIYKQLDVLALTPDGHEHVAIAYQVDVALIEGHHVPPHPDYLEMVRAGYGAQGLDDCMLNEVAEGLTPASWCLEKIFAYGTLMEGQPRHHILESWGQHDPQMPAKARGVLYDSGKGFPCMFPAERDDQIVTGELYPLLDPKASFEMLDIVEMVKRYGATGSLFRRAIIDVEGPDGVHCPAWVYLYDGTPNGMTPIPSGNWRSIAGSPA